MDEFEVDYVEHTSAPPEEPETKPDSLYAVRCDQPDVDDRTIVVSEARAYLVRTGRERALLELLEPTPKTSSVLPVIFASYTGMLADHDGGSLDAYLTALLTPDAP